jgi:hypothetical protein
MSAGELLVRAMLGGTIVSLFAVVGQLWKPKTFAGLFGAAPSVALATLGLASAHDGAGHVAMESRSMIAGAFGLVAYGLASVVVTRRSEMPVWLGAGVCWVAWGAVAFGVWLTARSLLAA